MNPITDIEGFLRQTIDDSIAAQQFHEFPWLEYKRQWYDLSGRRDDANHQEFVKDVTALANSGYDAFLVFGVDEGTASCVDAPFDSSRVTTQAGLQEKIWSRTDPPFAPVIANFDHQGKRLSYAYIKPTRNRPHVVREWLGGGKKFKNALFWREGARVMGPNSNPPEYPDRQVLTAMFLDRPERTATLTVLPWVQEATCWDEVGGTVSLKHPVQVANLGSVDTSVVAVRITVCSSTASGYTPLPFFTSRSVLRVADKLQKSLLPLIIPAGHSRGVVLVVEISNSDLESARAAAKTQSNGLFRLTVTISDIAGMEWRAELLLPGPR